MRTSALAAAGRVLFWGVITAAFIGPGTVTTAASAGAAYGPDLLWAVGFATLACWLLQEGAARLPLATGYSLGEALARRYPGRGQAWLRYGITGTILLGGAAYQGGNLLGAAAGLRLLWPGAPASLAWGLGLAAGLALWPGRPGRLARWLGGLVVIMGLAFLVLAWRLRPSGLIEAALSPRLPAGSGWLVVGLLGTTIVPYNLFLGSSLLHQQTLRQMRQGLAVAVLMGGLISAAILITGIGVNGPFSFAALAEVMQGQLGPAAVPLLALGLLAAGFTSAVTAPLASALTARSIIGREGEAWAPAGRAFRLVWGLTLIAGTLVAVSGVQPVPAILLAQALNGLFLPWLVALLILLVNDRTLMPPPYRPGWPGNLALLLVLGLTTLIGLRQLTGAAARALGWPPPESGLVLGVLLGLALLPVGAVGYRLWGRPSG